MKKATRILSLLVCFLMLAGLLGTARAEAVTLTVVLNGEATAEDGSLRTVRLSGQFRIWQNGTEAGVISAGESITLPGPENVRLEPLPETIQPGWDLTNAYQTVDRITSGGMTVAILLQPLKAGSASLPEETPAPLPDTGSENTTENGSRDMNQPDETDRNPVDQNNIDQNNTNQGNADPYQQNENGQGEGLVLITPEPETTEIPPRPTDTPAPVLEPLAPADGTGSVRVLVYNDKNGKGEKGLGEDGVKGINVFLLRNGEQIAFCKTDQNGMAVFENVPEGTYQTQIFLPDDRTFASFGGEGTLDRNAYQFSVEGEQISRELAVHAGQESLQGVGIQVAYHVSGFCWRESTDDGLYAKDESRMAGVRITLDGQKNGLHYETVSEADGSWRIDRVRPAFYTLTAYAPDGMMFARYTQSKGTRSYLTQEGGRKATRTIDLNDKENKENLPIGFSKSAEIRGLCYLDANYNGVYDEGELPLPGVKVAALKPVTEDEVTSVKSGEDGRFVLTGLRGNTYKLRALLPDDGSTFTAFSDAPLGNRFRSRPDRRENFWNDFLLNDAETREIAIGAIYPATIKGTVYMDDDFSGMLNGNEKIVSGFLVTLLDAAGNTVTSDKSNIKGVYELHGIAPGEYTLSVTAVKGYAFTRLGDQNVIMNRNAGEGYSLPFRVEIGDALTGKDIGMIRPGTVEGDVFADLNDNGIRDAGENGLPGVVVRLMSEEGEAFRAEIREDGHFLFDAVMPGQYYLEYELPENAVFARTEAGGNEISGETGTGRSDAFSFVTGDYRTAPLCGALTLGRISGTAYHDRNGNGHRDEGEETMEGMNLVLIPGRADLPEYAAVTGKDGAFALEGLRPDTYTFRVESPDGTVISRMAEVTLPLTAGKAAQQAELPVPMGSEWNDQMIGVVIPSAISGQVWLDENNNGIFDPEEATPAGLKITVTDEETGSVFDTPVTDAEGRFSAAGMIPGSFAVSFPLDENTLAPKPGDNQFREEAGNLVVTGITLAENDTRADLLLGIVRYTRISGHVWIDRGNTTEMLPGASVVLMDDAGNVLMTAVSGEDGGYAFNGLMPGMYRLDTELPVGCVVIEPGDSRLAGNVRSIMTTTLNRIGSSDVFELKMDHHQDGMDIGSVLPGSLGDFCWLDLNGDGLQGAGEGGIPGVRIEVLRNGEKVAEAVSNQYGFYRVTDLYPAAYSLRVIPPAEVKPTVRRTDIRLIASSLEETDGETCMVPEVTVESNHANYNVDLGFVLRNNGVFPQGYGAGETQVWKR